MHCLDIKSFVFSLISFIIFVYVFDINIFTYLLESLIVNLMTFISHQSNDTRAAQTRKEKMCKTQSLPKHCFENSYLGQVNLI